MQFQVPQFIETEDKIVGPLTIRQFIYIVITAGLSMTLFFVINTVVWIFVSIPLVGVGFALAFIKVNGRSLERIALSAFYFYWKPQLYVWQPEHPDLPKTESALEPIPGMKASLEDIISGRSLKSAWQSVQTGTASAKHRAGFLRDKERYQIFRGITGEKRIARRIDYR